MRANVTSENEKWENAMNGYVAAMRMVIPALLG